tara:strand:+ start:317 stop:697 length:381 start_codon:yes stop_codon:yes gene_type:complete
MLSFSRIILENNGKVLVQLRGNEVKIQRGLWSLFGGGIERGESKEEALVRELKEELDVNLKEFKYLFTFNSYFLFPQHIFYAKFDGEFKLLEGADFKWVSEEEYGKLKFALQLDKVLERFFRERVK